jgi:hypothetical protein
LNEHSASEVPGQPTRDEPNGKTYFNEAEGRFVVVDPKLTADDVRHWAALNGEP